MRKKERTEHEDKHLARPVYNGCCHLSGAGLTADPAEKGDQKFFYPLLSLLCTLCKLVSNDIPCHFIRNRFLLVRAGRIYGSSSDCVGGWKFVSGFHRCMYGCVFRRIMAVMVLNFIELLHMVINPEKTSAFSGFLRFFFLLVGENAVKTVIFNKIALNQAVSG